MKGCEKSFVHGLNPRFTVLIHDLFIVLFKLIFKPAP